MSSIKRRPSLLGGLLWTTLGVLFLLHNFSIGPNFWSIAGRYWPILLILLGLGKVIDYYRQKEGVSLRFGEVFGILFLLIVGTAVTRVSNSDFGRILGDIPIQIGDASIQPGRWIGTSYSYTQEASYPVSPATPLRIENAYGQVVVTPGSDDEVRVRLRKVVFQNDEALAKSIADEIKLEAGPESSAAADASVKPEADPSAKKRPDTVFLVRSNRDSLSSKDYRFNTEMEVFVPKKASVTVKNQYGELRAINLEGKLDLSTSHNQLEVHDCSGEVLAANRYAETRILSHSGDITINTRGRVFVETVKGNLTVRNEYAAVEIRDVDGKVSVSNTDSNVTVEKVSKPVVIEGQGCSITARGLADSLKVSTSHKRVQVTDVANVILDTRYANISLKDIKGNVDIASNSDRIELNRVTGYLKVKAEGSGIQANGVGGAVEINTTRKDVTVNNFERACKITNEYGDVTLSTGSAVQGEVSVKNRNGEIQLFLPEGAAFQIDATARNGKVESDFPGLAPPNTSGDSATLNGRLKTGGAKILLDTEYSTIRLRTRESGSAPAEESKPARRARRAV